VDVLNQPLVVSGQDSGTLNVVLSTRAGRIEGRVLDERAQPVAGIQAVLIPDQFRSRTELFKTAITDQNGLFTVRGITPGEYKLFAWEDIEQFAYFDPDFVRQFEQRGTSVIISESARVNAEVKIISAPE
jgi:hypothetical protein